MRRLSICFRLIRGSSRRSWPSNQIESVVVLRVPAAHQVIESRFALHIEMDDFTVQDGLARNRRSDGGAKMLYTPFPGAIPASIALSRYIRERGGHHISAQKSSRDGRRVHGGNPKSLGSNRGNTFQSLASSSQVLIVTLGV